MDTFSVIVGAVVEGAAAVGLTVAALPFLGYTACGCVSAFGLKLVLGLLDGFSVKNLMKRGIYFVSDLIEMIHCCSCCNC